MPEGKRHSDVLAQTCVQGADVSCNRRRLCIHTYGLDQAQTCVQGAGFGCQGWWGNTNSS